MASVVGMSKTGYDDEGKEMAMQVIAGRPVALTKDTVPAEVMKDYEINKNTLALIPIGKNIILLSSSTIIGAL